MLALHGANLKARLWHRGGGAHHSEARSSPLRARASIFQAVDKNGKTPLDVAEGDDTKSMLARLKQGAFLATQRASQT